MSAPLAPPPTTCKDFYSMIALPAMPFGLLKKAMTSLAVLVLTISIAACDIGSSSNAPDLPPAQVIEKASPAMQAANSFHFSMDTSKLDKPLPGIFVSKASGDVAKPDKLSADVTATYFGIVVNIKAV